jgi:hypothetical protein
LSLPVFLNNDLSDAPGFVHGLELNLHVDHGSRTRAGGVRVLCRETLLLRDHRDLRMIEGQPFAVGRLRKRLDRFPQ